MVALPTVVIIPLGVSTRAAGRAFHRRLTNTGWGMSRLRRRSTEWPAGPTVELDIPPGYPAAPPGGSGTTAARQLWKGPPPWSPSSRSTPRPWATAATWSTTGRSRWWSTRSATSTACSPCSTRPGCGSPTSSRPTAQRLRHRRSGAGAGDRRGVPRQRRRRGGLRPGPGARRRRGRGRPVAAGHRAGDPGHTFTHLSYALDAPTGEQRSGSSPAGRCCSARPAARTCSAPSTPTPGARTSTPRRTGSPPAARRRRRSARPTGSAASARPPSPRRRPRPSGRRRRANPVLTHGRAGRTSRSCWPGWTPGPPTTPTWARPTPPGPAPPDLSAPEPARRRRAAAADRGRGVGRRPARPHRVRRRARAGHAQLRPRRQFATYLGWLIPWGTPLTLLGETAEQVAEAQRELVRIGIDRPAAARHRRPAGLDRRPAGPVPSGRRSPTWPRSATTAP